MPRRYSKNELICALVAGSIGYYTPRAARLEVERYLRGEKTSGSERCVALHRGDLREMVSSDVVGWAALPEDRREKVREVVRQMEKMSDVDQTTVGLMWPTLGV